MKKVLSLVLVMAIVLSSMTFAFAFDDVDADNEVLTQASELLNGLKIVEGYEDGTFKPEKVVTRAEMAAMLIRAKGYASIANDTPSFTDCQKHWAKGYISLASDLGIINGRGNGIFDPDATVTYQEAAVMMLRALGYTNESINGGKSDAYNAANYRTKALSLNLFKDFTLSAMNDGANRGDIALMLVRNLSNSLVYTNEDGRAAVEKDENGDTVKLLNAIASKKNVTVDTKLVAKANLVDMTAYLYQNVDAYFKDDVVVYVDKANSTVKTGKVSATAADTITLGTGSSAVVYTLKSASENVFYNGDEVVYSAAQAALANAKATLVLDADSKVIGVVANEETNAKFIINTYKTNSTVINGIALPTKSGKVDLSKVTVTGAVSAIEDIKANDVVKAYASLDNTVVKLLVVRDSVEGKVTKTNNGGDSVYVDSIGEYKTVVNGTLALNNEGTFYLDENGNIFHFVAKNTTVASDYSMIVKANGGIVVSNKVIEYPTIKVMNAKGETTVLTIADNAKFDEVAFDGAAVTTDTACATASGNDLTLNAKLAEGTIIKSVTLKDDKVAKLVVQNVKTATADVDVSAKTFDPASNVVIFNNASSVYTVNTLAELVAKKTITAEDFKYVTDANGSYSVIYVDGTALVTPVASNGVIVEQQKALNAKGETVHELVTYINGEKVTYLTDKALGDKNLTAGKDFVNFTITNGVVTGVSPVSTSAAITVGTETTTIKNVTEKTFMNNTTKYFMNDGATIYVFNANGTFARVGAMSDLEGLNIDINLYVDSTDAQLVNNIVVILK